MSEYGLYLLELCNEIKMMHKYKWEREGSVETSMIDHILIKEIMKKRLIDVIVRIGVAGGISEVGCSKEEC